MLRPLTEFEREIRDLARVGATRVSVPDLGLYVGESLEESVRRMRVLADAARAYGVTLFVRNAHPGESSAAERVTVLPRTPTAEEAAPDA